MQDSLFHPIMKAIKGVIWQTEGSIMLASNIDILGGKKLAERYLFRTSNGNYFEQYHGVGIGGKLKANEIHPLSLKDAMKKYAAFETKYLSSADAFPGAEQA